MTSPKRLATVAGILYLLLAVFSLFAEMYVRGTMVKSGDAAATAHNIAANPALFRFGFLADLVAATLFLFVGLALYLLLCHANENVARAMVIFVALGVAIMCLNSVFQYAALLVATNGAYGTSLGPAGSQVLVKLLTDMNHYGFLIAQIFFGLWLLPLGLLAYQSRMFPRALGVLLMVGCFSYLADMLAKFLVPGFGPNLSLVILAPAVIAEFWMIGCLLLRGLKGSHPEKLVPAVA